MIQIFSTANVGTDGIKCMIYGGSGTGKTPSLATAPGVIIGSNESGLLSLRSANPPVPYVPLRTSADVIEFYNWAARSNEARQFYTIALDSLSECVEVELTERKRVHKDPRKAYGDIAETGVAMARTFRDIPGKNVIIVCKEEYAKDEATGVFQYGPMLPGSKLGNQLPYFFDETFRLEVFPPQQGQQPVRAFRTQRTFQHVARDRSGHLAEFETPNFTAIFRKILGI